MKKIAGFLTVLTGLLLLEGCGTVAKSSGAMQLGPDTYRIQARASLANQIESQKMAFGEAKTYCHSLSREMMTIGTRSTELDGFEVTFRCLKNGDLDLQRPNLEKTPDTVIKFK